jgi:hypothetical protein
MDPDLGGPKHLDPDPQHWFWQLAELVCSKRKGRGFVLNSLLTSLKILVNIQHFHMSLSHSLSCDCIKIVLSFSFVIAIYMRVL